MTNKNRENKNRFINKVTMAMNTNAEYKSRKYTNEEIEAILNTILAQIVETIKEGKEQFFTGFGSFHLQKHKGHPVQFNKNTGCIDDYVTVKFTASSNLNTQMREEFRAGRAVPHEKPHRERKTKEQSKE